MAPRSMSRHIQPLNPWEFPKELPTLLAPIIGPTDLTILVGPPAVGKTTLGLNLALSLIIPQLRGQAAGGTLLAQLDEFRDRKVAFIDGEDSRERSCQRIRSVLAGAGLDRSAWSNRLVRLTPQELGIAHPSSASSEVTKTVQWLAEQNVGFILVDSMTQVFWADDVMSNGWVQRLLIPFRRACIGSHIASLILCHPARAHGPGGKISHLPYGSSQQEAQADVHLSMRMPSRGARGATLTLHKSRTAGWLKGTSVELHFKGRAGFEADRRARELWPLESPDLEGASDSPLTPQQGRVHQLLQKTGPDGLQIRELAAGLAEVTGAEQLSSDTVRGHLNALRSRGLAELIGAGRNSRWRVPLGEDPQS